MGEAGSDIGGWVPPGTRRILFESPRHVCAMQRPASIARIVGEMLELLVIVDVFPDLVPIVCDVAVIQHGSHVETKVGR